jgi:hypothetical protein
VGGSLVVRRSLHHDAGPVQSLADALERGRRVRGALTVLIGDLTRAEAIVWTQESGASAGFALQTAHNCLLLERLLRAQGEVAEEFVVSGRHHVSMMRSAAGPTGGHLFVHITLARAAANLVLASMELSPIVRDLPDLVSRHGAPGLVRLPVPPLPDTRA